MNGKSQDKFYKSFCHCEKKNCNENESNEVNVSEKNILIFSVQNLAAALLQNNGCSAKLQKQHKTK